MTHPRSPRRRGALLPALLAGLAAAASARAQVMTDPNLTVSAIVDFGAGLDQPTTMKFVATDDFLVLEKATGRVRRVLNNCFRR